MSERDYGKIADPELIARLASWFGEGPLPAPTADDIERQQRAHSLAELEAVVDRELQKRLLSQQASATSLLTWALTPIEGVLDANVVRTRMPSGPLELDNEPAEYEQPDDIRHMVREDGTPQSMLRDLFRPVHYFGDVAYRPSDAEVRRPDPMLEVREQMTRKWGAPAPLRATMLVAEDLGALRASLGQPWADSAVDPKSRTQDEDENDHHRWFGLEGGYDPDL